MAEFGIFEKKFNGFDPQQVLDYIETMQTERVHSENELRRKIEELESQNEKLTDELNQQIEDNKALKEKIDQCKSSLNELYALTSGYSDDSRFAVGNVPVEPKPVQPVYKMKENSRFDIIKDKLSSLTSLFDEAKKYFYNK